MLRNHVIDRSASEVLEGRMVNVGGKSLGQGNKGTRGGGLGMMPEVQNFDI